MFADLSTVILHGNSHHCGSTEMWHADRRRSCLCDHQLGVHDDNRAAFPVGHLNAGLVRLVCLPRAPAEPGLEPGVPTLFAVSVKDHPTQIRMFETYADMAAYEAHLQTPHFKMYKIGTQHMVKSLTLIETDPILLAAKSK
jgi:hypothetical protein